VLATSWQQARKGIGAGQTVDQVAKAYKIPAGYTTEGDESVKRNFEMIYNELKAR